MSKNGIDKFLQDTSDENIDEFSKNGYTKSFSSKYVSKGKARAKAPIKVKKSPEKGKQIPAFRAWLDKIGKERFSGVAQAQAAYNKEFGIESPPAKKPLEKKKP